jgi:Protein of unknown function (DUF2892)
MKMNMANADRWIRVVISAIFAILFFTGTVTGLVGYILLAAAVIFTFTSVSGFCPIYAMLGLSTRKKRAEN